MRKIYRLLFIIGFFLLIGFIIFFTIKINPKIKTKMYKFNDDYMIVLNTNEMDKKSSLINIDAKTYRADFSLAYHQDKLNIYFLNIHNLNYGIGSECNIDIYLNEKSLIKFLME